MPSGADPRDDVPVVDPTTGIASPDRSSAASPPAPPAHPTAERAALVGMTAALFLVWSNTWLAFEVLLARKAGAAPMTWLDLLVVRFVFAGGLSALLCFAGRAATRRECVAIVRRHPVRLVLSGLLATPIYN